MTIENLNSVRESFLNGNPYGCYRVVNFSMALKLERKQPTVVLIASRMTGEDIVPEITIHLDSCPLLSPNTPKVDTPHLLFLFQVSFTTPGARLDYEQFGIKMLSQWAAAQVIFHLELDDHTLTRANEIYIQAYPESTKDGKNKYDRQDAVGNLIVDLGIYLPTTMDRIREWIDGYMQQAKMFMDRDVLAGITQAAEASPHGPN